MMRVVMVLIVLGVVGFAANMVGQMHQEWPYRYQNTTVLNEPKPGGSLELLVEVERTKLCPNKFYREIRDGRNVRREQFQWEQGAKPLGKDSYVISIPIPKESVPGFAEYCYAQEPECNWVQYLLPNWTKMKCSSFTIAEPK